MSEQSEPNRQERRKLEREAERRGEKFADLARRARTALAPFEFVIVAYNPQQPTVPNTVIGGGKLDAMMALRAAANEIELDVLGSVHSPSPEPESDQEAT